MNEQLFKNLTWAGVLSGLLVSAGPASAHVRYLISEDELVTHGGSDSSFLLQALSDPTNLWLMVLTVAVVIAFWVVAKKVSFLGRELEFINRRADSYYVFIPWILRLSLGIALIGAGVGGYLVSPVLSGYIGFAFIQILLGFFLLSGFAVVPSALVVLALYVFGLSVDGYLLGNLEFALMAVTLLVLDNERPGIDDLIGIPHYSPLRRWRSFAPMLLRVGVGGSMVFLAIFEKFINPHASEIIVQRFNLQSVAAVSPEMWVLSTGLVELVLGLALIIGLRTRFVAALAFLVLGLSFFYFGESVTAHITLFGALSAIFITRGGAWSVDAARGYFNQKFK